MVHPNDLKRHLDKFQKVGDRNPLTYTRRYVPGALRRVDFIPGFDTFRLLLQLMEFTEMDIRKKGKAKEFHRNHLGKRKSLWEQIYAVLENGMIAASCKAGYFLRATDRKNGCGG